MRGKRRAQQEFTIKLGDEDVSFLFRALGGPDWDKIVHKHPPTSEQRADGAAYNPNTFGPALLSACCVEPVLDMNEWTELWNSNEWSKGELSELFWVAVNLCQRGLDVNPIGRG